MHAASVRRGGGPRARPPADPGWIEAPDEILDRIDGLMLAGGADIDPSTYGAPRHPQTKGVVAERDAFELALTRRALERDMPFLGICRGMQMMNIATGGGLIPDLPEPPGQEGPPRGGGHF